MRHTRGVGILASAIVLFAGLGGAGASAGEYASSASAVSVQLVEWKLISSAKIVPAGKVTFRVANEGTIEHEFAIIRSDRHHHLLPVQRGQASEKTLVSRKTPLEAGETGRVTLKLKRGRYVLLCNLLGHYKAGQFAALRVR